MTEKELEAAASGFLDTAFNLGEPETAVSQHVGGELGVVLEQEAVGRVGA